MSSLRVLLSVMLSIIGSLCLSVFLLLRSSSPIKSDICPPSTHLGENGKCSLGDIESLNAKVTETLVQLLGSSFFRYYKINLSRPCPFWKEDLVCTSQGCAIDTLPKDPNGWEAKLSDIHFPTFQLAGTIFRAWEYDDDDFCLLDGEGESGVYVDLIENPERFTGYAGPSANKVWQSIYQENCFREEGAEGRSISSSVWKKCVERQVFYRVVSGLHASISVHLADKFYNLRLKTWESNFDIFYERVGKHKDRLRNMYGLYMLLFKAISRITPKLLETMVFNNEDKRDDAYIKALLASINQQTGQCLASTDIPIFSPETRIDVIEEFKDHFRNVTRIMDCVSCERCRLWGKIQTTGVGTALKIFFLSDQKERWDRAKFRRSEVIALFNTFGRLSESISAVERFRNIQEPLGQLHCLADGGSMNLFSGSFPLITIFSVGISSLGLSIFLLIRRV